MAPFLEIKAAPLGAAFLFAQSEEDYLCLLPLAVRRLSGSLFRLESRSSSGAAGRR